MMPAKMQYRAIGVFEGRTVVGEARDTINGAWEALNAEAGRLGEKLVSTQMERYDPDAGTWGVVD